MLSNKFISATRERNTIAKHINAPYMRKKFTLDAMPESLSVNVCGLGFYDIFVNGEKTYDFLSENNCLPKETPLLKKKSYLITNFLSKIFIRKNAKKFLLFGITFLLMSAFVVIKIYYLFCASVFITLSLFCRLFGTQEIKG